MTTNLGMDLERLGSYLHSAMPDIHGSPVAERIGGGQSNPILGLDHHALGLPSQAAYLVRYRAAGGHDEELTPFHLAFSLFRMAVIFEGIKSRAKAGTAAAGNAAEMGALAGKFAQRAVELIDDPQAPQSWK
ncbi:MAG: hypothetical protein Q7J84_16740 [Sulfuricaulis sp.]|nr:hypothetical protein [Sulfuricaulis sp.]